MTDSRESRGRAPSEPPASEALFLEEVRQARREERAPDGLGERVLRNMQRELGVERMGGLGGGRFPAESIPARLSGIFRVETRPLLGRLAGAALLVGVMVIVFADTRRTGIGFMDSRPAQTESAQTESGQTESGQTEIEPREPASAKVPGQGRAPAPPSDTRAAFPRVTVSSLLRSVAMPLLLDDANFPESAVVVARGDIAADEATLGHNFLSNGDFSQGELMWSVRKMKPFGDTGSRATFAVRDGVLCTRLDETRQIVGGSPWEDRRLGPGSFPLVKGEAYRLSMRAWSPGSDPVELVVKIGHSNEPYTPALVAAVPVAVTPGRFDIDFVSGVEDDAAGFAFVASGRAGGARGELCLDDVSVTRAER